MTAASPEVSAAQRLSADAGPAHAAGLHRTVGASYAAAQARRATSAQWQSMLRRRLAIADSTGVALAVVVAAWISVGRMSALTVAQGCAVTAGVTAVVVVWLIGLARARTNVESLRAGGAVHFRSTLVAAGAAAALLCVLATVTSTVIGATLLVVPFVAGGTAVMIGRGIVRGWLVRARRAGRCQRSVLLVGDSRTLGELGRVLLDAGNGVAIVGACVTDTGFSTGSDSAEVLVESTAGADAGVTTVPVVGSADQLVRLAASLKVDTVVLEPSAAVPSVGELSWELDRIGATLTTASRTADIDQARLKPENLGLTPFVHVARPTYRGAIRLGKRAMDVSIAGLMLLLGAIPMSLVAAAITLTSRGPVLFRQERIGLHGHPFTMFKFRSMVVDAEERLADLERAQDAGNAVMFKMKSDPRVTAVGSVLRRLSLDELPQLINVLRGDMSLVGPRPPLPAEVENYDEVALRRFLVKPGITGLWQVSGRSDLTWDQTVRCDRKYVENWSVGGDLSILARTVGAMNKGAY